MLQQHAYSGELSDSFERTKIPKDMTWGSVVVGFHMTDQSVSRPRLIAEMSSLGECVADTAMSRSPTDRPTRFLGNMTKASTIAREDGTFYCASTAYTSRCVEYSVIYNMHSSICTAEKPLSLSRFPTHWFIQGTPGSCLPKKKKKAEVIQNKFARFAGWGPNLERHDEKMCLDVSS